MPWGYIKQYRYPESSDGCYGPPYTVHKHYTLYPLLQGGSSKGIPWGRLKEFRLNYTTMNTCSEDVTASKAPPPLSMNILLLIYYLYFTQGASTVDFGVGHHHSYVDGQHTAMLWGKKPLN